MRRGQVHSSQKRKTFPKRMGHPLEAGRRPPSLKAHYREPKNQCLRHSLKSKTKPMLWEVTLRARKEAKYFKGEGKNH